MTDAAPTHTPRTRGRLTPEREREIYAAVLRQLAEHGFEQLRLDQVADDARCSKATLYRLWDGKLDLVVSALGCDTRMDGTKEPPGLGAAPDTGSLRDDLRAWADEFVQHHAASTALVLGLARTCLHHPDLAAAAHRRVISREADRLSAIAQAAVARGEIAENSPAAPLLGLTLSGPVLLHDILTGVPVHSASLHAYIDAVVLPALGAANPQGE